jgi:uncharacterized SAM-binding protein YcdF (DUF218 family)
MNNYWVFFAKKLLEGIFLPPFLPFLVITCGLLLSRRNHRRGQTLVWCGLLIGLFFITPVSVNWLAKNLEICPAVEAGQLKTAQAIVILGGGERAWAQEYGGAAPNRFTLERLRYGARLSRQISLPVLVSGGAPAGLEPEAKVMAESLKSDFGVTVQWMEIRSLDTADNARYSAEILKNAGIKSIVLVTTALHMRRAIYEFRHTGLTVIPAPTAFFSDEPAHREFFEYLPGISSSSVGSAVAHEWVGILAQHIRDDNILHNIKRIK